MTKKQDKADLRELKSRVSPLVDSGLDAHEISAELDIPFSTVCSIMDRIANPCKMTCEESAKYVLAYLELLKEFPSITKADAAKRLGVTVHTITHIRRKENLAVRRDNEKRNKVKKAIEEILKVSPGLTSKEVAALVGVSKSTANVIRIELGLARDKRDSMDFLFLSIAQQVKNIFVEFGNTITDRQFAEKVGVSLTTLYRWLDRLGIPTGKNRRYSEESDFFRKMWDDGWSDVEIANVMGCSHQRISQWRSYNGLIHNVIHIGLHEDYLIKSYTPTTLLDQVGSPMGSPKLDKIWGFAALGADREWLCKRFPDTPENTMNKIIESVIAWEVPRNLREVVRKNQLLGKDK